MKQNQQQALILNARHTSQATENRVNKLSPSEIRKALTQSARHTNKKIEKQYRRAVNKNASLKSDLLD